MTSLFFPMAAAAALFLTVCRMGESTVTTASHRADRTSESFHDFTVQDIDGKDVALSKYKGNVCLVVNVASK